MSDLSSHVCIKMEVVAFPEDGGVEFADEHVEGHLKLHAPRALGDGGKEWVGPVAQEK